MQLEIVSPDFPVTDAIRDCVQNKIQKALIHFEDRLGRVHVGLSDVNGPRRGEDKRCRIDCNIQSLCRLSVEDTETDLYAAIDQAAERMGRAVERQLLKRRSLSRMRHPETSQPGDSET
jgi:putative sigma-54 modulation protein